MSVSASLRAMPTMLRVGLAETIAYRAEMIVWILTTTMPLVMLALWTSVAAEAPFAGFTELDFVAYYLAALRVLFTAIIPLALMTTYPAMALRGVLSATTVLACLAGAAVFFALSRGVWKLALRGYTSASS